MPWPPESFYPSVPGEPPPSPASIGQWPPASFLSPNADDSALLAALAGGQGDGSFIQMPPDVLDDGSFIQMPPDVLGATAPSVGVLGATAPQVVPFAPEGGDGGVIEMPPDELPAAGDRPISPEPDWMAGERGMAPKGTYEPEVEALLAGGPGAVLANQIRMDKDLSDETARRTLVAAQAHEKALMDRDATLAKARKDATDKLAVIEADSRRLAETEVDPDRYWNSKGTGEKVTSYIFAGIAAYLNPRGPNSYVEHIQRTIDNDIALQKDNLVARRQGLSVRRTMVSDVYDIVQDETAAAATVEGAMYANLINVRIPAEMAQYQQGGMRWQRLAEGLSGLQAASAAAQEKNRQVVFGENVAAGQLEAQFNRDAESRRSNKVSESQSWARIKLERERMANEDRQRQETKATAELAKTAGAEALARGDLTEDEARRAVYHPGILNLKNKTNVVVTGSDKAREELTELISATDGANDAMRRVAGVIDEYQLKGRALPWNQGRIQVEAELSKLLIEVQVAVRGIPSNKDREDVKNVIAGTDLYEVLTFKDPETRLRILTKAINAMNDVIKDRVESYVQPGQQPVNQEGKPAKPVATWSWETKGIKPTGTIEQWISDSQKMKRLRNPRYAPGQ